MFVGLGDAGGSTGWSRWFGIVGWVIGGFGKKCVGSCILFFFRLSSDHMRSFMGGGAFACFL